MAIPAEYVYTCNLQLVRSEHADVWLVEYMVLGGKG